MKETHTHTAASIRAGDHASTGRTNELKDKRGYLDVGWGTQPQQYNATVQSLRCHIQSTGCPGQVLASPTSRRHVRRPGAIVAETGRLRPIAVLRTLPALHLHVAAYAAVFLFALVAARYHCTFSWLSVCMHGQ